ncbi:MAG: hypothetical protein ABIG03_06640 [Candidatus Eisenbacteria bacterium]
MNYATERVQSDVREPDIVATALSYIDTTAPGNIDAMALSDIGAMALSLERRAVSSGPPCLSAWPLN